MHILEHGAPVSASYGGSRADLRYHPDIASAFAYVWADWLVIAIGLIFGARNSPGWFCILSELRADIAANYDGLQEAPLHHLVKKITIPAPPSSAEVATFAQAQADAVNPGTVTFPPLAYSSCHLCG